MTRRSTLASTRVSNEVAPSPRARRKATSRKLATSTTTRLSINEDDLEALTERAAIMEYDGGLPRATAERSAVADVHPQVFVVIKEPAGAVADLTGATVSGLDPRLQPFIEALVEMVLADLSKAPLPPKESP